MYATDVPRIQKWGNSLAVRIPKSFALQAGFSEAVEVTFALEDGAFIVRRHKTPTLAEMLKEVRSDTIHEAMDFGPDVGKELV